LTIVYSETPVIPENYRLIAFCDFG
jgi:hypothetical protein